MTDVPPNDLDAEAAVLSALLQDNDRVAEVATILTPEQFHADANRHICKAVYDLIAAGQPADLVTVAARLRETNRLSQVGGASYVAQIIDATPFVQHVGEHAKIVRDKWRLRRLIELSSRARAEAYAPVPDPDELFSRYEEELSDIAHIGRAETVEPVARVANRTIAKLIESRERGGPLSGLSTGFGDIDKMTGGLFGADYTVIAARPGMGKTSFVTSLTCNVARPKVREHQSELGYGALFFSLEMGREQLCLRFACHEAELDFSLVRRNMLRADDWKRLLAAADSLKNLPVWIDDTPGISLFEAAARIRKLKREIHSGRAEIPCKGLKLTVFDYLQLMTGIQKQGGNREQEVASISKGSKELAKREDLAVVQVSQLNRYLERHTKDKRPALADLRESGSIEQDADSVWFLFRESYYDTAVQDKNSAELIVAKQRNGETGSIALHFSPRSMRFQSALDSTYNFDDEYYQQFDQ